MVKRQRLKLTRTGKYFLIITLGIGLAAVNTGNNLLFLLLGWLLSTIVASGVLSSLSLKTIRITRSAPKHVYANTPFVMEMVATNKKKRSASYSLEIQDVCDGRAVDKSCFFLKIPEGQSKTQSYRHSIVRRGLYTFDGFRISTTFPFGLFEKQRVHESASELLVFPATGNIALPASQQQLVGDSQTQQIGRQGEFFGLREYREGDERRTIHWRSSARRQKLMVREYEDESQRRMTLQLDNTLPTDNTKRNREEREQSLEDAISQCAALSKAYLERGYAVRLIARGQHVPFAAGAMQTQRVLRALALMPTVDLDTPFAAQIDPRAEAIRIAAK